VDLFNQFGVRIGQEDRVQREWRWIQGDLQATVRNDALLPMLSVTTSSYARSQGDAERRQQQERQTPRGRQF
jgi:hypothetical protein